MNKEQLDLLLKLINKNIRSDNLSKFTFGNTLVLPLTEDSEKIDINYLMSNYIGMLINMLLASAYQNNGNLVDEDAIVGKLVDIKQYIIETIGEKNYESIIMMIADESKNQQNIFRVYIEFDYLNDNLYFEITTKDKVIQLTCDYYNNNVDFHSIVTDRDSQVINLDGNSVVPQSVEPQPSSRYLTLNMSNKNYIATLNNNNVIITLNDDRISQLINDGIDNDNIEISLVVRCNTDVSLSFDGFHYMLEENSSCGLQANCCYNIIIKRVVDMYLIKIDKYISTSLPS